MEPDPIDDAAQRLIEGGLAVPETLVGCSEADLQQVEDVAGGPLPAMYRRFMQRMGRSAGDFMRGTDILFPHVLSLRRSADALLRDCGGAFTLGATDFIFASHQGYQFLFFDRALGDNPPVHYFLEGEPGPRQVFLAFSDWLRQCIADEVCAT